MRGISLSHQALTLKAPKVGGEMERQRRNWDPAPRQGACLGVATPRASVTALEKAGDRDCWTPGRLEAWTRKARLLVLPSL